MTDAEHELYAQIMQFEREWVLANPPAPRKSVEPQTILFSELPEAAPDSRGATEWNCYRREVARLLAEGHEGRWVLIRGEGILGVWDTQEEAERARSEQYPAKDALVKQIRTCEPIVRGGGYDRRWR